jgi:Ca2+-transporting ATPase
MGADIGIAMGESGTAVTKQASDMIITDDNFATIVAAVEEGRGIYDNIRKTLQYLLAGSTGGLLLMTVCVVGGLPTPLLPIHLLWINLVTDGLPALCLATDPIDPDVMRRHPRRRSERMTERHFLWTICFTGFLTAGVAFAVYCHGLMTGTTASARTSAFAVLVFAELLRSFGARSEAKSIWQISLAMKGKENDFPRESAAIRSRNHLDDRDALAYEAIPRCDRCGFADAGGE